jgi:hypothetical protein
LDSTTLIVGTVAEAKGEPAEPLKAVIVGEGKVLKIGTCLTIEIQDGLITFLQQNLEVFAWTHEDMLGISQEDILH